MMMDAWGLQFNSVCSIEVWKEHLHVVKWNRQSCMLPSAPVTGCMYQSWTPAQQGADTRHCRDQREGSPCASGPACAHMQHPSITLRMCQAQR